MAPGNETPHGVTASACSVPTRAYLYTHRDLIARGDSLREEKSVSLPGVWR